ncbi:MAG: hypothetical protein H2046_09755, partial [Rhizobiales bacterium]|nr:hypothetical protein [Hyphomicrobiales bacterium]
MMQNDMDVKDVDTSWSAVLFKDLMAVRVQVVADAADLLLELGGTDGFEDSDRIRLENLCHYLALRRHDLRPLQRKLM